MSQEDARDRRLRAVAILCLIVLAASAPFGWYLALKAEAQRTELCNSLHQKMAAKLIFRLCLKLQKN